MIVNRGRIEGMAAARRGARLLAAAAAAAVAVAGCRSAPRPIELVSLAGRQECTALGPVEGMGVGGSLVTREQMLWRAENDVIEKATGVGATHLVVVEVRDRQGTLLTMSGQAYRCQ